MTLDYLESCTILLFKKVQRLSLSKLDYELVSACEFCAVLKLEGGGGEGWVHGQGVL